MRRLDHRRDGRRGARRGLSRRHRTAGDGDTPDGAPADGDRDGARDDDGGVAASATTPPPATSAPDTSAPTTGQTEDVQPDEPLASVDGSAPIGRLEVIAFERADNSVTLEFDIITPEEPTAAEDIWAAPGDAFTTGAGVLEQSRRALSGVTLVDHGNAKRHLVLRDSADVCLCGVWPAREPDPETRYRFSAQFPAPPPDVTSMSVEVPNFPVLDDVALRAGK